MSTFSQFSELAEIIHSDGGLKQVCNGYKALSLLLENADDTVPFESIAFLLSLLTDQLNEHLKQLESLTETQNTYATDNFSGRAV